MITFAMIFVGLIFFGAAIYRKKFMNMVMQGIQGKNGMGDFATGLQDKIRSGAGVLTTMLVGQRYLQKGGMFNKNPVPSQTPDKEGAAADAKTNGVGLESSLSDVPDWVKNRSGKSSGKDFSDEGQHDPKNAKTEGFDDNRFYEDEYPEQETEFSKENQWIPDSHITENGRNEKPLRDETSIDESRQFGSYDPIQDSGREETSFDESRQESFPDVFLQGTIPSKNVSGVETSFSQEDRETPQKAKDLKTSVLADQSMFAEDQKKGEIRNSRNAWDAPTIPSDNSQKKIETSSFDKKAVSVEAASDVPSKNAWDVPAVAVANVPAAAPKPVVNTPVAAPKSVASDPVTNIPSKRNEGQQSKNAWDVPAVPVANTPVAAPKPVANTPVATPKPVANVPVTSTPSKESGNQQSKNAWDVPAVPVANIPAASPKPVASNPVATPKPAKTGNTQTTSETSTSHASAVPFFKPSVKNGVIIEQKSTEKGAPPIEKKEQPKATNATRREKTENFFKHERNPATVSPRSTEAFVNRSENASRSDIRQERQASTESQSSSD